MVEALADGIESKGSIRAQNILRCAYDLIAEKGFEGLRTRAVADREGINVATLHYHFPTKEALVRGVVGLLMAELQTCRSPAPQDAAAAARLRAEFEDVKVRLRESPHQLIVLTELSLRSARDPEVAALVSHLDHGWRANLVDIFRQGVREGAFNADLDLELLADCAMAQLRGLGLMKPSDPQALERIVDQACDNLLLRLRTGPDHGVEAATPQ